MNTLGTLTVIRGKGACDVMVNGELSKEVCRINKLHAEEMELVRNELQETKKRMYMMPIDIYKKERLAAKTIALRYGVLTKPSPLSRIRNYIEYAWGYTWVFGIKHGLWGYWDDEDNEYIRRALKN